MFEKNRRLISFILILVIIFLIAVLILNYILPYLSLNMNSKKHDMIFLTKSENNLYGVVNNKGKVLIKNGFKEIARNQNTIYLKGENVSYLYSLDENKNMKLNGKETNVIFACDKNDKLLPYFIMRYGKDEKEFVYRIYTLNGKRYLDNDFATLKSAKEAINAKGTEKFNSISDSIKSKYDNISVVNYLSNNGETQFIASRIDDKDKKFGVISESGKVIYDFKMKKINNIDNCYSAIYMEDDNNSYIFNKDRKLIKVDNNFEYIANGDYIIQKRGNNITKILDTDGNVIINEILDLQEDIRFITNINNDSYIIIKNGNNYYEIYDVKNKVKIDKKFIGIKFDDFINNKYLRKDSIIYSRNGINYAVDLKDFNEVKLGDSILKYYSFDYGFLYK